jgi:hypothetical protein
VVNNNYIIPDSEGRPVKNFGSYNAPSVNSAGIVVFRARSVGGGHDETDRRLKEAAGPSTGVFVRDMSKGTVSDTSIIRQAGRRTKVPQPNNLDVDFFEFPSFPRKSLHLLLLKIVCLTLLVYTLSSVYLSFYHAGISKTKSFIATRGNHQGPVWEYATGADTTRVGNAGVYVNLIKNAASNDATGVFTAFAKLGAVGYDGTNAVNFTDLFAVPGIPNKKIPFDIFPGSPAVDDYGYIGTKGNYQYNSIPQTGVFYRNARRVQGSSIKNIEELWRLHVIANSETYIPDPISGTWTCDQKTFGSTAPPSISDGKMVFLGVDNETDPKCGGIYLATMHGADFPCLSPLVDLATEVPGQGGATFSQLGEILSFDGQAVSFWGAWGNDRKDIILCCPTSGEQYCDEFLVRSNRYLRNVLSCLGNRDRRDYCNNAGVYFPHQGDQRTIEGNGTEGCPKLGNEEISGTYGSRYQIVSVPVNQGFFVYDGENIKAIHTIKANETNDLVYWVYSGKPPAMSSGGSTSPFKRRLEGDTDAAEYPKWRSGSFSALSAYNDVMFKQTYNGRVGVWHWDGENINPVVQAGESCSDLDSSAGANDMVIDNVLLERDGYRSSRFTVAASCSNPSAVSEEDDPDWGGVYVRQYCPSSPY